jgi:hypothetical protein
MEYPPIVQGCLGSLALIMAVVRGRRLIRPIRQVGKAVVLVSYQIRF